jgi:hypothetical protein
MLEIKFVEEGARYSEICDIFEVQIQEDIISGLSKLEAGYSGGHELLVFGGEESSRPLIDWNQRILGLGIYPLPKDGGPVFLAESAIGIQFGFRIEKGAVVFLMFDPNTFESYVIAESVEEFIYQIHEESFVTMDGALTALLKENGPLKMGYHLAPFVSPLIGGSLDISNWGLAPAFAHIESSHAEFKSVGRT